MNTLLATKGASLQNQPSTASILGPPLTTYRVKSMHQGRGFAGVAAIVFQRGRDRFVGVGEHDLANCLLHLAILSSLSCSSASSLQTSDLGFNT